MSTALRESLEDRESAPREIPNGAAVAAFVAAGIGSFAMGLLVVANEAGIFAAPSLYPPAGGLSGRTTFAIISWLAAWALLHVRWRGREIASIWPYLWTAALIAGGIVATFPPAWRLL